MNIVFDFGAVVFRWQPAALVGMHFPSLVNVAAPAHALASEIFGHADWLAFDRGALDLGEVVHRTALRLALDPQSMRALVAAIPAHMQPIESTQKVLDKLRALRAREGGPGLYFLSNMPAPIARDLERRHAFLQTFDGGIFSGDVLCTKPQPAIFELLSKRYQLAPESTVFIDDALPNVEAARQLGWKAIHLAEPDRLAELLVKVTGLPVCD